MAAAILSAESLSIPSWKLLLPYDIVCAQTWLLQTQAASKVWRLGACLRPSLIPIVFSLVYLAHHEPACHFRPPTRMVLPNFMIYIYLMRCCFDTLEVGFATQPYKWVGFSEGLRSLDYAARRAESLDHSGGTAQAVELLKVTRACEAISSSDLASLAASIRGIGLDYGIDGSELPAPVPNDRFLADTLRNLLLQGILAGTTALVTQLYGDTPTRHIWPLGLPRFLEVWLSRALLALSVGVSSWTGIEIPYLLCAIGNQLVTCIWTSLPLVSEQWKPAAFDSRAWPRLMRNPTAASSLKELWTFRWHSFLRRHIVIFGCRPAGYLTSSAGSNIGRASAIMGGFIFSAVFMHALPWYFATDGDYNGAMVTFRFFFLQGVGMVLEGAFRQMTGRPVGGWSGRLWLLGWQAWLVPDLWEAGLKGGIRRI